MNARLAVVLVVAGILAGCSGLAGIEPGDPAGTVAQPTGTLSDGDSWTVTVVEVVDGDTMEIQYRNGTRETIRLLGVDAPEPRATVTPAEWDGVPDTDAGRAWLRGWAENASAYATQQLEGETVQIATDDAAGRRGGYGRLLVYVVVDGEVFGEELLEGGYARLYETTFARYDAFSAAESRAQAADRGIWGYEAEGAG